MRGVELAWEQLGEGPVFLWGHGLHSCRADEDGLGLLDWGSLAEHHRVVRYDARGHGESGDTQDREAYSWDALASDQLVLADALGIDRYAAGGASLGAATALHAAVLEPERIEKLLLVIPPTGWETRAAQTDLYEAMAKMVETKGVEPMIEASRSLPLPDPLVDRPEWQAKREHTLRQADVHRMAMRFRGATTANLPDREACRSVTADTLILAWSGDPAHPASSAEELADLLPSATLDIASTWDAFSTWTNQAVDFLR